MKKTQFASTKRGKGKSKKKQKNKKQEKLGICMDLFCCSVK